MGVHPARKFGRKTRTVCEREDFPRERLRLAATGIEAGKADDRRIRRFTDS